MEFLLEPDAYWPPGCSNQIGVRNSTIVPPRKLEKPERLTFDSNYTVVTPGWIDAHTHLELSGSDPIPSRDNFTDWICEVFELKRSLDPEQRRADYRQGCEDLVQSGVARIVDHCSRPGLLLDEMIDATPDVIPFMELVNCQGSGVEALAEDAKDFLGEARDRGLRAGLAPHSPYCSHPSVYRLAVKLTDSRKPISTHLHEIPSELNFAENNPGSMKRFPDERTGESIKSPYGGERPFSYLVRDVYEESPSFAVNLFYLNDEDLRWLEASRVCPVFCPKSYVHFDYSSLPVGDWIDRSLDFALGTGSRVSNPSLNILEELRQLHELNEKVFPETVMRALTTIPANTLGIPERGVLTPGTPADLSVFEVPSGQLADLARGRARALAVIVDGEVRWSTNSIQKTGPAES